jgi:hypothetical protein
MYFLNDEILFGCVFKLYENFLKTLNLRKIKLKNLNEISYIRIKTIKKRILFCFPMNSQ